MTKKVFIERDKFLQLFTLENSSSPIGKELKWNIEFLIGSNAVGFAKQEFLLVEKQVSQEDLSEIYRELLAFKVDEIKFIVRTSDTVKLQVNIDPDAR